MSGEERRQEILVQLNTSEEPISGGKLATYFQVSRQVIVQDIALLKVANHPIVSTCKGYLLNQERAKQRVFQVHHTHEQISDELNTIVDAGGRILDVFVQHEVYGTLRADLAIASRKAVGDFVSSVQDHNVNPLMHLTKQYHYHTVEADSEQILDQIEQALHKKEYLV